MHCNGNATEICGGPNRLSLWDFNNAISATPTSTKAASSTAAASATPIAGWDSLGCYTDSVGARTLATQLFTIPGGSMTPQACTAACKAGGYILAGVEYADECYCGNTIQNGGAPASSTDCNMPCNGNTAYMCGGPNRINLYKANGAAISSTTSSSGTATGTSTSSSSAPTVTGLPTGWTYKGCWLDQQFGRILGNQQPDSNTETIESCVSACLAAGYSIAGMEYHTQCFCGNAMINQAVLATAETDCNTPCGGNANEICGGGNRMSIYSNQTTLAVTPVPKVQKTGLPGSWNYTGCLL
jgi:hypothetical protein